ncbi:SMI1/KNR4 family protein [Flavobacterium sp. SUN052]|uniref:SMI1/KNR4 family protein n=1 Tax=Flavobacterium sp. SUN052 TaxID=3002441 RepID=UPI00237E6EFF|nr:SMI1/KNR4 family protein [Flavobacterium sp. SUN052]MEC4003570.1 SMI1/KNR4 family protein [Flavobacterium sp. SUN052]
MFEIERIFTNCNFIKRTDKLRISVNAVEQNLNFSLPADYIFFAENYIENENFVGNEYIKLWDFNEILKLNTEYEINENLKNIIAIGGNGSSELIAIEFIKPEEYRIVLVSTIDLDKANHIEIGNSFTDFFYRLENGKDWFN